MQMGRECGDGARCGQGRSRSSRMVDGRLRGFETPDVVREGALWVDCPGVFRGSPIALCCRRRRPCAPGWAFDSRSIAASILSSMCIASSTRQAKPYQPARRTIRKTSARSYHSRSSRLTALATT